MSRLILPPMDERHARLLKDMIQQSAIQTGKFTLTSGQESNYLFDMKKVTLRPDGAFLIGSYILEVLQTNAIHVIAGPAIGAVPIISSVCALAGFSGYPMSAFYVRKVVKSPAIPDLDLCL